jgi:hypothetical protein
MFISFFVGGLAVTALIEQKRITFFSRIGGNSVN